MEGYIGVKTRIQKLGLCTFFVWLHAFFPSVAPLYLSKHLFCFPLATKNSQRPCMFHPPNPGRSQFEFILVNMLRMDGFLQAQSFGELPRSQWVGYPQKNCAPWSYQCSVQKTAQNCFPGGICQLGRFSQRGRLDVVQVP